MTAIRSAALAAAALKTARGIRDARATQLVRSRSGWWLAGLLALAASALFVRHKTRQAEAARPPHGRFIGVDGVLLHVVERGEGEPLLLLHGTGNMALDYEIAGLVDRLAQTHRVIAIDRPGYGWSERPRSVVWTPQRQAQLVAGALRQLGVARATVVGHSWGTLVALALAQQYPQLVRAQVLVSGYYYPTLRLEAPVAGLPAIPLLGDLLRYTLSPIAARLMWPLSLRVMFGPAPVPARFKREFPVWFALRPKQLRAAAAEVLMATPSVLRLRRHYDEMAVPTVLVAGDADRYVSARAHTVRLHEQLERSALRIVPGVGHMVHYSAPEAIVEAVAAADAMAAAAPPARAGTQRAAAADDHELVGDALTGIRRAGAQTAPARADAT